MTEHTFAERLRRLEPEAREEFLRKLHRQRLRDLREAPRTEPLELSPAQGRIWYLARVSESDPSYNIPGFFRIHGEVTVEDLRSAVHTIGGRHEILRSAIVGETPETVVRDRCDVEIDVVEAPGPEEVEEWARTSAETFLRRTFDLETAPLWRIRIVTLHGRPTHLVGSFHHLIFDGWSLTVFMRELLTLLHGQDLEPLEWQYPDYARLEQGRRTLERHISTLRGEEAGLEADESFWCEYLRGLPEPLELQGAKASATSSNEGRLLVTRIPAPIWEKLVAVAREENATPFAAALAVFTALLFRRSRQDDVIVGTPVNGRLDRDTHPLIGTFVNTIPIRTRLDQGMDVRSLLRAVSASSVEAIANDGVPFDRIVELTKPVRRAGTHPIFQTLFTFQPAMGELERGDLRVDYLDLDFGTAKFDLSLDMIDELDGIRLVFEYRTEVFAEGTVEGIAEAMVTLAEHMAHSPDTPLTELPMMTAEEHADLIALGDGPEIEPEHPSVLAAFSAHARENPDAPAVVDDTGVTTYGELDRAGDRVRDKLAGAGVGRGVIGVLLPRSSGLIAAILGVWKHGATSLVLDPSLPLGRIRTMVDDAGAVVVTERLQLTESADLRPATGEPLVLAEAEPARPPEQDARAAERAYVVYTSGSTGLPKGIAVSQRAYARMGRAWQEEFRLSRPRVLQIAASGFDVFYGDLARALVTGGALRIVSTEVAVDPEKLAEIVTTEEIDFAEFVPSVFRRLAGHLRRVGRRIEVGTLVVASEPWSMSEARDWLRDVIDPRTPLYNTYGVAEATVDSTVYRVEPEAAREDTGPVPIGRALPNVRLYVVGERLDPVPRNTVGEILIGGHGVAMGYLGPADDENDKFTNVSFGGRATRVYRTGDFGYWDDDGRLVFIGRRDGQVKLRGVRIELSEVDDAVRGLPGVHEAATVVTGHGGAERLATWVVTDVETVDLASWRRTLLRGLPTAMVPEIVVANELPMLASGKIDRRRLGRWELPERAGDRIAPRTVDEQRMHTLFREVLDVEALSVDDDFFALGGHSLTALDLIGRIRKEFGVKVKIAELFDHPTVEGLLERVLEPSRPTDTEVVRYVEPDRERRQEGFPLTDVQQAYWLGRNSAFEFSSVSTHSYDEFYGSGLDLDRFTDALNEVIARHEMMRCVIVDHNTQRILPEAPRYVPSVYDLSDATQAEVDQSLEAVREEMSHQRLDVTTWPTFDIRVSVLPGDGLVLHFSTDALLLDAWSFVLVVKELSLLHDGARLEEVSSFSFRDYVLAEKDHESSEEFARAQTYWNERVPHIPPAPELPMRAHPDDLVDPRFTRLHSRMEKDRWDNLKRAAAARGITASSLCLTAYARVLASRARDPRFSVNLTFLSRKPIHPDVDQVVGEFTSVTLLPIDLSGDPTFFESAKTIQRDLWEVLGHHEMSGVKVQRAYAHYHRSPTAAHFPVVFTSTLGGIPMPDENFPMRHQPEFGVTQTSQVWLDSGIWEDHRGDLRCNWDVVLEVYPEGFVESLFEDWVGVLRELEEDPGTWDGARAAQTPRPLDVAEAPRGTLLEGFLAQADTRPDDVALIDPRRSMTYADLRAGAGGVALWLGEHDVDNGEPVAVIMSSGWEQTVAVLGIVAVGAYLPMSPDMPDERLRGILEQASVRCVVTQGHLAHRVRALGDHHVLTLGEDVDPRPADAKALHDSPVGPDDLAYVIFTSGSTGRPKGVMIDHKSALNTVLDVNERYGVGPSDRVLALSELGFDLSVYDIFGTLAAGGAIVVPDATNRLDPLAQDRLVREHGVTLWNSVPALFQLYLGALDEGAAPPLRVVLLSGDWIPLSLPVRAAELVPGAAVHSLGGATEASIWSITHPIHEVRPEWTSIPYGTGMKYQDVLVLDEALRECADWVTGDLYIRGAGLALGYWGDREQTDAAFFAHPKSGERLYRTGDLGRRMPDGVIEFLGRSDFQLKISGYRVEAGEVEKAMTEHPAVDRAVVLSFGAGLGDKRLACVWTRPPGEHGSVVDEELTKFLSERLQSYMVPTTFMEVDRIPLSGNGKVDRKAIDRMLEHLEVPTAPFVAPATADEKEMITAWSRVLGRTSIGMYDDFFQIGGSSIEAIELITRVRKRHEVELRLGDLYTFTTPRALLDRLREVMA